MPCQLIGDDHDISSMQRLQLLYDARLIAPEKKPFLVDLKKSFGPYLAVDNSDQFILDACSQIATIGLGFNASPLFGCCQHLESWTGDYTTDHIQAVAGACRQLLKRLLGSPAENHHVHFCSSGAEAIEIALAVCFAHRRNRQARKVLAFDRSFHGRMMVALSATWNKKKREPFAWPGYEAVFAPYPEMKDSDLTAPPFDAGWKESWADENQSADQILCAASPESGKPDSLLELEVQSLDAVRMELTSGEVFAVLIEPMQCEGGDRYSSARFHHGLLALAHSFGVPVVYDEVQTGFHLGNRFFWHSQFELKDVNGNAIGPDVIACAKKAQTGVVISRFPVPYRESFCPASLTRGYITASIIDQFDDEILDACANIKNELAGLVDKYDRWIENPRARGTCFAFDFKEPELLNRFVKARFRHGLLFYPAGDRTARFRMNLAIRKSDREELWQQLNRCLSDAVTDSESTLADNETQIEPAESIKTRYEFHQCLIESKNARLNGVQSQRNDVKEYIESELQRLPGNECIEIVFLNSDNYAMYRERILKMQSEVYEPVRQSAPEEFDVLFDNENSIDSPAFLLMADESIAAMAFCGPLSCFKQERGIADDPFVDDEKTFYMLDLTVASMFRGRGLGGIMKNAITMLALSRGIRAVHGRNRDRLARAMWAINLGLGSFEQQRLFDDYPDAGPYRDCIYYRCPIEWKSPQSNSDLPFAQLDIEQLNADFFRRNMPSLVNKICLSNFVPETFLDDLEFVSQTLPESLRHLYTASSLSESIDKVAKVIWLKRKPRADLLTFRDHYFGEGSFLARSLSGVDEPYFDVTQIADGDLEELTRRLSEDRWLAFFVQTSQMAGRGELLQRCVDICRDHNVPIVFNETGSRFGTRQQFSRNNDLIPDAGVAWLGGQMALTYVRDYLFADDPLMLISTWDGDAYALARFAETMRQKND